MPKRKHAHRALGDFLERTYAVLEDPSLSPIISWDEAGTSFEIKDVTAFSSTVLPQCFQLPSYASFLHHLSLFDFRREPGRFAFSRVDFTREAGVTGRERRYREVEEAPEDDYQQLVRRISLLQRSQCVLKQEIASLQDHRNVFKETNELLQAELQRFRERSDRIEQVLSRFYRCAPMHFDHSALQDKIGALPESTEEEIRVQS